ncbi:MAG TPA: ferredoxin [Acidimicrobiales bacterium]|nr:ferredoxin [Acidimicrobiales bacterium]
MHVIINLELCEGHGQCVDAAPDVFELRDDGLAYLLMDDIPESYRAQVDNAALRCPPEAILIVD